MDYHEEDYSADPKLGSGKNSIPFPRDEGWVEIPGSFWTPELEYRYMPPREPTPGEMADNHCRRGGLEADICPVDFVLEQLDFVVEYISPKKQASDIQRYIEKHNFRQSDNRESTYFFDEDNDSW